MNTVKTIKKLHSIYIDNFNNLNTVYNIIKVSKKKYSISDLYIKNSNHFLIINEDNLKYYMKINKNIINDNFLCVIDNENDLIATTNNIIIKKLLCSSNNNLQIIHSNDEYELFILNTKLYVKKVNEYILLDDEYNEFFTIDIILLLFLRSY